MRDTLHVDRAMGGERAPRGADTLIACLAGAQHGVVARRQLRALGLSDDAIDHRLACGRLHAVHRGVFAVGHRRLTREGAWTAAVLAAGPGAALAIRSAAALLRIRAAGAQEIDVMSARHRRSRAGIRIHHVPLAPDEVTVHRGIPVTTPARTLLDLAAVLDPHALARAVDRAEALRLASPTSLHALLTRHPRRAGAHELERLLATHRIGNALTRSELEDRFLDLVDAEDLPRPLVNAACGTSELDFTWRAERLVVEVDGYETHGTREAFERDRARDRALQAAGWRVARITWRQLDEEPHRIAKELRALLYRQRTR